MKATTRAYLQVHTSVLLYGWTGIFGLLISLPTPALVWWRMFFTVLSFLFWPGVLRELRAVDRKALLRMVTVGCLVAVHWVTFFGAIVLTNASVTLAVIATSAFFTSIFEPLMLRRPFKWYELALGVLVVPGVALVMQSTDFGILGIFVALVSAMLAAFFSVLNKGLVGKHNPIMLTFVELGSGWLFLSALVPIFYLYYPELPFIPVAWDWLYLGILAFACTSLAFVFTLRALQVLPTFTINLSINLEPVYTIIIAYYLFHEGNALNWQFYLGAFVIIVSVFLHPILTKVMGKDEKLEMRNEQ
jgi:drug/metabolite transporter (DMT)-like permease